VKEISVSNIAINEIYRQFDFSERYIIFDLLKDAIIPISENVPLYRVLIAIIRNSEKSITRLQNEINRAINKCDDVLVDAELSEDDWRKKIFNDSSAYIDNFYSVPFQSIQKYELTLVNGLVQYLNGTENGSGYSVGGGDERLKQKYGEDWKDIRNVVETFLFMALDDSDYCGISSLSEIGKKVCEHMISIYKFIDLRTAEIISNYVTFSYR